MEARPFSGRGVVTKLNFVIPMSEVDALGCDNEYWPTCADEFWPTSRGWTDGAAPRGGTVRQRFFFSFLFMI